MYLFVLAATVAMPFNLALTMVALGIGYIAGITLLQRKVLTNPMRMAELQLKISGVSAKVREHFKNGNKELAMQKQKEMGPHMKESMRLQMKSMFVVLPLSLAVYFLLLPAAFGGVATETINFIVPMTYINIFFWTAMIAGFAITMTLTRRDKQCAKARMAMGTTAT